MNQYEYVHQYIRNSMGDKLVVRLNYGEAINNPIRFVRDVPNTITDFQFIKLYQISGMPAFAVYS